MSSSSKSCTVDDLDESKEEDDDSVATHDRATSESVPFEHSKLMKKLSLGGAPLEKCSTEEKSQESFRLLMEELTATKQEIGDLERELEMLETVLGFDDQHPSEYDLKKLDEKISASMSSISDLESQWDLQLKDFEEKKRTLQNSLYGNLPDAQEKLDKLRCAEHENELFQSEIRRRDEEIATLTLELEKQPKLPSRKSYVERVKEITKNSRKQDADILRILKDTRELQLESNSIQERLHRTYAVVDEIVYREANKNPTGRQAYRLLTSIHDNFEQIVEKILETDRAQRESAELEKKLLAKRFRIHNSEKVQNDVSSQEFPQNNIDIEQNENDD